MALINICELCAIEPINNSTNTICGAIMEIFMESSNVCKTFKPELFVCSGSIAAVPTVPSSLHCEENARISAIKIVIM